MDNVSKQSTIDYKSFKIPSLSILTKVVDLTGCTGSACLDGFTGPPEAYCVKKQHIHDNPKSNPFVSTQDVSLKSYILNF